LAAPRRKFETGAAAAQFPVMTGPCAICGRIEVLTRHHLIPRTRHSNKRNKREFDRHTVKKTAGICRPCHSQIHAVLSEKELEREFPTIDRLKAHPDVARFAAWINSKPPGFRPQIHARKRQS
jgi:hypothetical protein